MSLESNRAPSPRRSPKYPTSGRGNTARLDARRQSAVAGLAALMLAGVGACGGRSTGDHASRADVDTNGDSQTQSSEVPFVPSDTERSSEQTTPRRPTEPLETTTLSAPGTNEAASDETSSAPSIEASTSTGAATMTTGATTTTASNPTLSTINSETSSEQSAPPAPVPIEGPGSLTGCTEIRDERSGHCDYTLDCDSLSVLSSCYSTADGGWSCQCFASTHSSTQTLRGVEISEACPTSVEFCIEELAPEMSELTCEAVTASADSERCSTSFECERTTTASGEVSVTEHVNRDVACYPAGDGRTTCSCTDPAGHRSFVVDGLTLDDGCATSAVCDWSPSDDELCTALDVGDGGYCDAQCGKTFDTGSKGVTAIQLSEGASAHCEVPTSGDPWYCSCDNYPVSPTYFPTLSASYDAEDACLGAVSVCRPESPFESPGAPNCDEQIFENDASSCSVVAGCTPSGTSGGYTMELRGGYGIATQCQLDEAGRWQCSCESTSVSPLFTIDSESAPKACSSALQTCITSARYERAEDGAPGFVFDLTTATNEPLEAN